MRRGIGRPGRGLIGTMAATAVVAGTAGAVHHRQEQKWANQNAQQAANQQTVDNQAQMDQMQQQMAQMQAQQVQTTVAPAAAAPAPDMMAQLNQLAQMKSAGILSEEEFQAAKAKLLA